MKSLLRIAVLCAVLTASLCISAMATDVGVPGLYGLTAVNESGVTLTAGTRSGSTFTATTASSALGAGAYKVLVLQRYAQLVDENFQLITP